MTRNRFQFDTEGYYIVYIAGSCKNNGSLNAIAGCGIYFGQENWLNRALPVYGRATSNAAEIQAATAAIQVAQVHGIKRLCIRTDSEFLFKSVMLWMPEWKRNHGLRDDGHAGDDLPDFRELDVATHWITVKGEMISPHSDVYNNECAHRLAEEGADKYEIALKVCSTANISQ